MEFDEKKIWNNLKLLKDIKTGFSVFLVTTFLYFLDKSNYIEISPLSIVLLNTLWLTSAIRLVFFSVEFIHTCIERKKEKKQAYELDKKNKERKKIEKENLYRKIKSEIENADIFELLPIQELQKLNSVKVVKSGSIYSLINKGIIKAVSSGQRTYTVALTIKAKEVLDKEVFEYFHHIKFNSIVRFFSAIQDEEKSYFLDFLNKDTIGTELPRRGGTNISQYRPCEHIYSRYSKTILFTQPQRNHKYTLDPVAINALKYLFEE